MFLLLGDWVPEQTHPVIKINTENAFVLLNLEGPVLADCSAYTPIVKSGPYLFSNSLPELENASAVFVSLANNHMKDYGWPAVEATIELLNVHGYYWAGAGENEQKARDPLLLTVDGTRCAIFSVFEVQAGRAMSTQSGCAALGPWIYGAIARIRSVVDCVIVSCHAGSEYLPWPSPLLQDIYRSLIDAGADMIHGHHSHVPQGIECYQGGLICYGLGNFIASPTRYPLRESQHSLGVRVDFVSGHIQYQVEPYHFHCTGGDVVVEQSQDDWLQNYREVIQEPLTNRHLLEALWQESALWLYDMYGRDSIGFPKTTEKRYASQPKRVLASYMRRFKRQFPGGAAAVRQNQMLWYNLFACFSHQHMMETSLGLLCGEIADVRTPQAREMVAEWLPKLLGYDETPA